MSEFISENCCDICYENLTQYYMCPSCKTKNCTNCFETYLNNYIDDLNTSYDIQCPGCKRILNSDDIKNTCGSSFMDNFVKQLAINNMSDLEIKYGHLISKFKKENSTNANELDEFKRLLYSLYYNNCKPDYSIIYETEVDKYFNQIDIETKFNSLIEEIIATKNDFEDLDQCYDIMTELVSEFVSEIDNKYSTFTLQHLKSLVLNTMKMYYPDDKILGPKQYRKLTKKTDLNISIQTIMNFIDNNIINNEQNLKICRCDECEYGIVYEMPDMKCYVCKSCNSQYCKKCLKSVRDNHECDKEDLENAEYLFKNTKPCPNCTNRIEKNTGCDDMYCTYCKCGFSWTTGRYITHNFHNPHRMEDLKNGITQNIELPDQICSDVYIFAHNDEKIVNKFKYIIPNLQYLFELKRKFRGLIIYWSNKYDIKDKLIHLLDAKFNDNYETAIDYFSKEYIYRQIEHNLNIMINIYDILIDFFIKLDQIMLNEEYIQINENELINGYNNLTRFIYELQLDLNYDLIEIINDKYCDKTFYNLRLIKCNSIELPIPTDITKYIDICLNKEVTEDTIDSNFKWLSEKIKPTQNIDLNCNYIRHIVDPFPIINLNHKDRHYNTLIEKYLREIPTYFNEKLKNHNVFIGLILYTITNKDIDLEKFEISATNKLFDNLMKWIWCVRHCCINLDIYNYVKKELFDSILN